MPLGWVDFSKDGLGLGKTIDELQKNSGRDALSLGYVQKGYANLFYPGSATQFGRAKYLFLVPAALLELSKRYNEKKEKGNIDKDTLETELKDIEFDQSRALLIGLNGESKTNIGIIGSGDASIAGTPVIKWNYWSMLKEYGMLKEKHEGLDLKRCTWNVYKKALLKGTDMTGCWDFSGFAADTDAFLDRYRKKTLSETLSIDLDEEERAFLKTRIQDKHPASVMAEMLNIDGKKLREVLSESTTHEKLYALAGFSVFSEPNKEQLKRAAAFAEFSGVLFTAYNLMILNEGETRDEAVKRWNETDLTGIAKKQDLNGVFDDVKAEDVYFINFIKNAREIMISGSADDFDNRIPKVKFLNNAALENKEKLKALTNLIYDRIKKSPNALKEQEGWTGLKEMNYYTELTGNIILEILGQRRIGDERNEDPA